MDFKEDKIMIVNNDTNLKWTGERLVTSVEDETAKEHLHRYMLAMKHCQGLVVVDIACGEGYGSAFLASVACTVMGVDIDAEAVKFASKKYKKSNLEYKVGNCSSIPVNSGSVDVVVSFETLEHHDQHAEMLLEVKRVLKPDGLLIVSSPDKTYYSDQRNFKNAFHVKELTNQQFEELIKSHFKSTRFANQRMMYGSLIVPDYEEKTGSFELYEGDYTFLKKKQFEPFYNIAFASDGFVPEIEPSFFNGDQILIDRMKSIYKSNSFRLGYLLLTPFRIFSRWLSYKK
jgi:2-polyprenyl-3-methyl-5-hydroxy-6-metoxy-1,4-benzoquinol methylase